MKISIIIPVYNVEAYVERCLKSVMTQTYHGTIECLIVDDCGTDKSMEVVEKVLRGYQGSIDFKILRHDCNRGLSAARNTGMDATTGDYLFFLDSDDEISADCIEAMALPLKEEQYDLVVGNVRTIGCDSLHRSILLKLEDGKVLRGKEIESCYHIKWKMIAVNKLYRTDFIRQQGLRFKEGLVHEDELWSLQVACLARSLRAVNKFTYVYYMREGSIMHTPDLEERRCRMLKIIVAEICKFLKGRHLFSVRAYQLMQKFFWRSLRPSLNDKKRFVRDYCELRSSAVLPLIYHIRASGSHFRVQMRNFYYILPPRLAGKILFHRINKSSHQSL